MVGGATTGSGDDEEEVAAAVAVGMAGGAKAGMMVGDASKRAIFRLGAAAADPKLPSSSMKRLGVLMMRSETVLTTGMMNCLMFFRVLRTPPASALTAAAAPPFSSRFCAPFLARCSNCLAMVASVRLEDGTILTGFLWRGLFRRPAAAPAATLHELDESEDAGGPKGSWPSACWRT